MNRRYIVDGVLSLFVFGSALAMAQQGQQKGPPPPMSFFVTSVGAGKGANLGGLSGADAHCQKLAEAAGAGNRTWHAYLSTSPSGDKPGLNARDRIGQGPWFNAKGQRVAKNLSDLHGDTLEEARVGNTLTKATALTEKGDRVNGFGDTPNQHDILTGSQPDGTAYPDSADHTCGNWTERRRGQRATRPLRPHRRAEHILELRASQPRLQPGKSGEHGRRGLAVLLRRTALIQASFTLGRNCGARRALVACSNANA